VFALSSDRGTPEEAVALECIEAGVMAFTVQADGQWHGRSLIWRKQAEQSVRSVAWSTMPGLW